jgi:hypothetical protein
MTSVLNVIASGKPGMAVFNEQPVYVHEDGQITSEFTLPNVLTIMFNRYIAILDVRCKKCAGKKLADLQHIKWMCTSCIQHITEWPEDKLNRWLGYVQGILSKYKYIDVEAERDFSRPLFHAYYIASGIKVPSTLSYE